MEVVDQCIRAAGTAPSGAHKQPWTFAVVTDPDIKRRVREAAEEEERENYGGRMTEEWLEDLRPFGTNAEKPFLEVAPALIVVFEPRLGRPGRATATGLLHPGVRQDRERSLLLAALAARGLAKVTHTPSPMGFLGEVLAPAFEEREGVPLIPIGYPADDCQVPRPRAQAADRKHRVARY